ncbi:hypothetical protein HSR121_1778 [Halapricum desulfuricans]|uniref:Uncharacterized protein n=1 Tax=Halapricum desulfuricans TaxID=2841257 RepID=A0A897N4D0_9EURY|nr:hypothetical protein HSR121_1778 [Halapricum desulfuricans]
MSVADCDRARNVAAIFTRTGDDRQRVVPGKIALLSPMGRHRAESPVTNDGKVTHY